MDSVKKDSRFSRVLTDPRFQPMPTYHKKVKIDKRFNALFTSKDFGHRTILDKRGRPIHDVSKRGKHIMEQYYQISSDESDSSEKESESDEDSDSESDNDDQSKDDSDISSEATHTVNEKTTEGNLDKKEKKRTDVTDKVKDVGKKSTNKKRMLPNSEETTNLQPTVKKLKKGKLKTEAIAADRVSDDETDNKGDKTQNISKKALEEEEQEVAKAIRDDESSDDKGDEESSSESDDDDGVSNFTKDFELEETKIEHKWNELHTDAIEVTDSTYRLAVCNMDWDFVKAQDLYVLFKSFAGEGETVRSVTIYPSEFGKERMAEEVVLGPKEMRDNLKNKKDNEKKDCAGSRKERRKNRLVDQQKARRMERQVVKEEREVLRNYQLNRLRYYYAVVVCSSVEAADNIYKECDGQEYQLSCVKLDLRFIPDDMTFDDEPKESFSEEQVLADYTPSTFNSTALSQAKVEVTWDETEFDRLQKKMLHVQHKELEEMVEENKHADIIAPPESDSDLDEDERPQWLRTALLGGEEEEEEISEERKIELYRKVLMDKLLEEEEKEKRDNEVDKEMEWQPGLKSAVASKLKEKEQKQGTVIDDYLKRKKEKKKKKREKKAALAGNDDTDDDDKDDEEEMPNIIDNSLKEMMASEGVEVDAVSDKKKKKKVERKRRKAVEEELQNSEEEREAAELELLLMGDGDEKKVAKPEKVREGKLSKRQKKKKALEARQLKKKEQEELNIDVDDPRFSAMFTSHLFHIDPSAPEFKKTHNMMKLVDEQIKRKTKKDKKSTVANGGDTMVSGEEDSRTVSKKLLESLKRKMKKK